MERISAAVAGATGLVGGRVLALLLADPAVTRVVAPTRRPLPPHPKLENPSFDGRAWPALGTLDEAYGCLGTTMAKAGSESAFRAVDLELTRSFAAAAKFAGDVAAALVGAVRGRVPGTLVLENEELRRPG